MTTKRSHWTALFAMAGLFTGCSSPAPNNGTTSASSSASTSSSGNTSSSSSASSSNTSSSSTTTSSSSSSSSTSGSGGALEDGGLHDDGGVEEGGSTDGGGAPAEFVYVATYLGGIVAFSIDPTSGELLDNVPGSPFDAHAGLYGMAFDSSRKILYAANNLGNSIDAYRITPGTGALTPVDGFPLKIGTPVLSSAVDPLGRFAYFGNFSTDPDGNSLYVYSIEPTSGALTAIGAPIPLAGPADAIAADPSGHFLYMTGGGAPGIRAFSIGASGVLSDLTSSPFAKSTVFGGWMAFHPNGKLMYNWRSSLQGFNVDTSMGDLGALSTTPFATGQGPDPGAMGIAVDPLGRFVCAANTADNTVSVYAIEAGGGLHLVGSPVPAGTFPFSVAIDLDGRFVYVGNDDADQVTGFAVDPVSLTLEPMPHPFPAHGLQPEIIVVRAPTP